MNYLMPSKRRLSVFHGLLLSPDRIFILWQDVFSVFSRPLGHGHTKPCRIPWNPSLLTVALTPMRVTAAQADDTPTFIAMIRPPSSLPAERTIGLYYEQNKGVANEQLLEISRSRHNQFPNLK